MTKNFSAELVLQAYASGIFPMGDESGISWYSADPRFIIDLDNFHIPKRLARKYRQNVFDLRLDTAFSDVIEGCASRQHTWITPEIVTIYTELHHMGFAHSIEAFQEDKLVGGLYGISMGAAFMAESMFYRVSDASKICLIHLATQLKKRGYTLLDAQFMSPETRYLEHFGAKQISRLQYLQMLSLALQRNCHLK